MSKPRPKIHPEIVSTLKALQESADKNAGLYERASPSASLLERFDAPRGPGVMTLNIISPEFTSLCPITKQPDFARIVLDYVPDKFCLESKSWKLYLGSWRNFGAFHEQVVTTMVTHLVALLDPVWLTVQGQFTPRGGIPFWPTRHYRREQHE